MAKKDSCCMLEATGVGIALGLFMGGFHLLWVILVALGVAQAIYDWILSLHFISLSYSIGSFEFWTALELIVFTAIVGFIGGYIFASIWNYCMKKK
ncbi:MAG TPA: hypothetical protein P5096_00890 [Patescibacteria group bacterium]|nr:hypothetical protein [Patescibacteria group bacterium]